MKQYYSFLIATINIFFTIGLVFAVVIFFGDHDNEVELFCNFTKTQIYVIFITICSLIVRYLCSKFLKYLSENS